MLGILDNALGPKQDVILVQLLGEKAEHSGVVAGMSGSPVYFDGKLAGALSLKLGVFTKEAIGGVTPIANMLSGAEGLGDAVGSFRERDEIRRLVQLPASRVPLPTESCPTQGAACGHRIGGIPGAD